MRITKRQLRRIIREAIDYPEGYERTNVDKVYEIIQPLLDELNIGLDRQGEISVELAGLYDATTENPHEILNHAEDILKTDAGYHDEDEEEEQRYAAGRPWEHN
jgi:flagellin-specific chaperone FliS